ncbi:hypothetical protein ACLOJK_012612 [Asimina triloba]
MAICSSRLVLQGHSGLIDDRLGGDAFAMGSGRRGFVVFVVLRRSVGRRRMEIKSMSRAWDAGTEIGDRKVLISEKGNDVSLVDDSRVSGLSFSPQVDDRGSGGDSFGGDGSNGKFPPGGGGGGDGDGDGDEGPEEDGADEEEFGPLLKLQDVIRETEARRVTLPSDMLEAAKTVGIRKALLLRYFDLQATIVKRTCSLKAMPVQMLTRIVAFVSLDPLQYQRADSVTRTNLVDPQVQNLFLPELYLNQIKVVRVGGSVWPIGAAIKSCSLLRDRMLADPSFLFKVATEVVIDSCCATIAEVKRRGNDFWAEFELFAADLLVGVVVDIALVGLLAPYVRIGKSSVSKGVLGRMLRVSLSLPSRLLTVIEIFFSFLFHSE